MDDASGQFIWAGWDADTYIADYRHMIDLCRKSAPDISVMWSPLGDEEMAKYYPGDDYADLVGLTVFGLQAWDQAKYGKNRSFDDVFGPRYERASAFGKPVVVAELGYVGGCGLCQKLGGFRAAGEGQISQSCWRLLLQPAGSLSLARGVRRAGLACEEPNPQVMRL